MGSFCFLLTYGDHPKYRSTERRACHHACPSSDHVILSEAKNLLQTRAPPLLSP
jgi:hypothetical protein